MIVVDTSALIAVLADEPEAVAIQEVLTKASVVAISAATLTEALIVSVKHQGEDLLNKLLNSIPLEVVAVTEAEARRVAEVHSFWGPGRGRAQLNWGDCYSYSLAKQRGCPLLFVGMDFRKTDVKFAL